MVILGTIFALLVFVNLLLGCRSATAGLSCGGLLDSDAGSIEYRDDIESAGFPPCVWVLRLRLATVLSITADRIGLETKIGVYTREEAFDNAPLLHPIIIFKSSTEGTTATTQLDSAIVILQPSNSKRTFGLSFRGEHAPALGASDSSATRRPITSIAYLDTPNMNLDSENDGHSLLVVNPAERQKLNMEMHVPHFGEECLNISSAVFEVGPSGEPQEITRSSCGKPIILVSLRPPLIVFTGKEQEQPTTISTTWTNPQLVQAVPAHGNSSALRQQTCGGSITSSRGQLDYKDCGESNLVCIWTIHGSPKTGQHLTLLQLSPASNLGILSHPTHSNTPSIETHSLLEAEDVGRVLDVKSEIVIIVLYPAHSARSLKMSWVMGQPATDLLSHSISYFNSQQGDAVWHTGHFSTMGTIINPAASPTPFPLLMDVRTPGFDSCTNITISVYEMAVSPPKEIAKTCGHSISLQNVQPPLYLLVTKEKPDVPSGQTIRAIWNSVHSPSSLEDAPIASSDSNLNLATLTECGGVLVGATGVIRYKLNVPYEPQQTCFWSVRADLFTKVEFELVQDELYPNLDYITISTLTNLQLHGQPKVVTDEILYGGDRTSVTVGGPLVFVSLRTIQGGPKGFELRFRGLGPKSHYRPSFRHLHYEATALRQSFSYPDQALQLLKEYSENTITTLVFNTGLLDLDAQLSLQITFVDIEPHSSCSYDQLTVLGVDSNGHLSELDKICGRNSSNVTNYSLGPDSGTLLMVFKTDESVEGKGFHGSYIYDV